MVVILENYFPPASITYIKTLITSSISNQIFTPPTSRPHHIHQNEFNNVEVIDISRSANDEFINKNELSFECC